jgi:hypothetical protein
MANLERYILAPMNEAAFRGNIGFEEMVKFYREANDQQKKEMDKIVQSGNWDKYVLLIHKVTGVKLK